MAPFGTTYTWIPRAQNSAADALANKAMDDRADASTDEWLTSLAPTAELGSESDDAWPGTPDADESTTDDGHMPDDEPQALFDVGLTDPGADGASRATASAAAVAPASAPTGGATRVYLIRHGVTEWTVAGRQSGSDTPGPDRPEEN